MGKIQQIVVTNQTPESDEYGVVVRFAGGSGPGSTVDQGAAGTDPWPVKFLTPQEVIITSPIPLPVSFSTPVEVVATNLDIRDLAFATDKVDVSGSSVTVPGVSTSANQATEIAALASILGQLDVALSTRASQATLATILAQLDVALSTRASQVTVASILAQLDVALSTRLAEATFTARINTLGQKTMALSTPVVLPSDQSTLPVGTATVTNNGLLSALNNSVILAVGGYAGFNVNFTINNAFIGTLTYEFSNDSQITWKSSANNLIWDEVNGLSFNQWSNGTTTFNISNTFSVLIPFGTTHIRVRVSAYTSGNTTALLTASQLTRSEIDLLREDTNTFLPSKMVGGADNAGLPYILPILTARPGPAGFPGVVTRPMMPTNGTQDMPTMDAVTRPGFNAALADVLTAELSAGYTTGDTTKKITQTPQGFTRVLIGALVSENPKSYLEDEVKPLSINSEGRLRVSTYPANTNFDFFAIPDLTIGVWNMENAPLEI